MAIIKVEIKDVESIKAALKVAPAKIIQGLNRAVERILVKVTQAAMVEAPAQEGKLRQSIKYEMTGTAKGRVYVNSQYGLYVHDGTAPHTIRIVTAKVLANKRTGQFFGKVIQHPGTRANPFLQRAVDQNNEFIDKEFADAVTNALK